MTYKWEAMIEDLTVENEKLRKALKLARQYVQQTHAVIANAAGHNNVVLPDLELIDAALNEKTE